MQLTDSAQTPGGGVLCSGPGAHCAADGTDVTERELLRPEAARCGRRSGRSTPTVKTAPRERCKEQSGEARGLE